MIKSKLLKVNSPDIVYETIDGEAILLDLRSGNYFSLDGAGAAIWDYIAATGDWKKSIDLLIKGNEGRKDEIFGTVENFISELMTEGLLVPAEDDEEFSFNEDHEEALKAATKDFKAPVVNKYSDMKDLLLLDPIHDVDEEGWPEAPDEPPENTDK